MKFSILSKLSTFVPNRKFLKKSIMSGVERKYQKDVDELILNATPEELKQIQEIDMKTQLSGNSFYDSLSNHSHEDAKLTSPSPRKKNTK